MHDIRARGSADGELEEDAVRLLDAVVDAAGELEAEEVAGLFGGPHRILIK